jgi:hypothetical protein
MNDNPVLRMQDIAAQSAINLLNQFGILAEWLADGEDITGSFWGAPEAGIIGKRVYVRGDTPVHSFLHETSHIICMKPELREQHTGNAESDDLEESAVCYLQILLGGSIPGVGQDRLMQDMDTWGYSFRLGSTQNWFTQDAQDAKEWLQKRNVIDRTGLLTGKLAN